MPEAGSEPVYLDGDEWQAYFRDFKRSAFRLEVHQTFTIVDVAEEPNHGLPEQDFWMFDEATVVHLDYRPDGTQIGRELIQDPDIDILYGISAALRCNMSETKTSELKPVGDSPRRPLSQAGRAEDA